MDVNQNYCQSCHLISQNGFIIRKIMSSQICCKCMGNVITLSECAASREYCKAISGKTPFWARLVINLVQRRNTGLKIFYTINYLRTKSVEKIYTRI
jgi:hypothetical protein